MVNKYLSKKTTYQGITFDSKKEMLRYIELKELEKLGKINNLQRQVKFTLQEHFRYKEVMQREISYYADFVYEENGKRIVEDVKSYFTKKDKVYSIKKKMLLFHYPDIEFREYL